MGKYETHKTTEKGRRETIARRQARQLKRGQTVTRTGR